MAGTAPCSPLQRPVYAPLNSISPSSFARGPTPVGSPPGSYHGMKFYPSSATRKRSTFGDDTSLGFPTQWYNSVCQLNDNDKALLHKHVGTGKKAKLTCDLLSSDFPLLMLSLRAAEVGHPPLATELLTPMAPAAYFVALGILASRSQSGTSITGFSFADLPDLISGSSSDSDASGLRRRRSCASTLDVDLRNNTIDTDDDEDLPPCKLQVLEAAHEHVVAACSDADVVSP